MTPELVKSIEREIPPSQSIMVNVYSSLPKKPSASVAYGIYGSQKLPALIEAMEAFKKFLLD